jgi:hypothetical protein
MPAAEVDGRLAPSVALAILLLAGSHAIHATAQTEEGCEIRTEALATIALLLRTFVHDIQGGALPYGPCLTALWLSVGVDLFLAAPHAGDCELLRRVAASRPLIPRGIRAVTRATAAGDPQGFRPVLCNQLRYAVMELSALPRSGLQDPRTCESERAVALQTVDAVLGGGALDDTGLEGQATATALFEILVATHPRVRTSTDAASPLGPVIELALTSLCRLRDSTIGCALAEVPWQTFVFVLVGAATGASFSVRRKAWALLIRIAAHARIHDALAPAG